MVLLTLCDANYCSTLINLGQFGSNNDSEVLLNSKLAQAFSANSLNVPDDDVLIENDGRLVPYYLLVDEVFSLKKWLMRPYPALNPT